MIEKMFSPEEWAHVWNVNDPTRHPDDAICQIIHARLEPYAEALVERVREGTMDRIYFVHIMTTLSMIEELEIDREMRQIQ
jgi:hypothetical protein